MYRGTFLSEGFGVLNFKIFGAFFEIRNLKIGAIWRFFRNLKFKNWCFLKFKILKHRKLIIIFSNFLNIIHSEYKVPRKC